MGAVIVRESCVIGEGWHVTAGQDHAEVAAIHDALMRACRRPKAGTSQLDRHATRALCSGATMYVSLEPCCTQGRTPPCTTALIDAGFKRVVTAALDPSPLVNGKGVESLKAAGVQVEVADGLIAHRARRQNNGLRKIVTTGLPFVDYKYAMTLDGRVATDSGDARWISSPESRMLVHKWRSWADAVVVGGGTVARDDPTLTARDVDCGRQPLRVVVDGSCSLEGHSRLFQTVSEGPVLLFCGDEVDAAKIEAVRTWGVDVVTVPRGGEGRLDPRQVCSELAARGVQTVLLEGGPTLAGAWWSAGLVDKVSAFVCPKLASGEKHAGSLLGLGAELMQKAPNLCEVEVTRSGVDVLVAGYTGGPF